MSLTPRTKGKSVVDSGRLSGPEKAAVILLSLGEDHGTIWRALDEEEIKEVSQAMAGLGNVSAQVVEELLVEFVSGMSGGRLDHGLVRTDPEAAGRLHARRQGRQPDGGDPRSRGSDHVGQARQRERGRARQLPEERIPADGRGHPLEDQVRARRARAGRAAGGLRARMRDAHAAHGAGAARDPRQDRADAAHRVHVQPGAHLQARQPRDDGGDLQQLRPPDREPLHRRAGRAQPRERRAHPGADVRVRGPLQARSWRRADAAARRWRRTRWRWR